MMIISKSTLLILLLVLLGLLRQHCGHAVSLNSGDEDYDSDTSTADPDPPATATTTTMTTTTTTTTTSSSSSTKRVHPPNSRAPPPPRHHVTTTTTTSTRPPSPPSSSQLVEQPLPNPTDMLMDAIRSALVDLIERNTYLVNSVVDWVSSVLQIVLQTLGLGNLGGGGLQQQQQARQTRSVEEQGVEDEDSNVLGIGSDYVVPIIGRKIHYDDLHFIEKFIMDTVEAVRVWNRRKQEL